jgi:hypothetical protein
MFKEIIVAAEPPYNVPPIYVFPSFIIQLQRSQGINVLFSDLLLKFSSG